MAESGIWPARLRDSTRIAEIYNQSVVRRDSTMDMDPLGPSDVAMWLEKQGEREHLAIAQVDSEVLGWGILKAYHPRPGYARAAETSMYVDRGHTGQGHGSALQKYLIQIAREYNYHHLVAKIWADNAGSIRIHERFGYETVGVQREIGYVDGAWQDVAILQLILD